jgi:hypothetical protein
MAYSLLRNNSPYLETDKQISSCLVNLSLWVSILSRWSNADFVRQPDEETSEVKDGIFKTEFMIVEDINSYIWTTQMNLLHTKDCFDGVGKDYNSQFECRSSKDNV